MQRRVSLQQQRRRAPRRFFGKISQPNAAPGNEGCRVFQHGLDLGITRYTESVDRRETTQVVRRREAQGDVHKDRREVPRQMDQNRGRVPSIDRSIRMSAVLPGTQSDPDGGQAHLLGRQAGPARWHRCGRGGRHPAPSSSRCPDRAILPRARLLGRSRCPSPRQTPQLILCAQCLHNCCIYLLPCAVGTRAVLLWLMTSARPAYRRTNRRYNHGQSSYYPRRHVRRRLRAG